MSGLLLDSDQLGFEKHDGGRAAAGFVGQAGDCVTRAIAIATGSPYLDVYTALKELAQRERITKRRKKRSSVRDGCARVTYDRYLKALGWRWYPTMQIGQGCKVHLRSTELPHGVLIVRLSRHLACVIDHVIYDTHCPDRAGTRCVYGYYTQD